MDEEVAFCLRDRPRISSREEAYCCKPAKLCVSVCGEDDSVGLWVPRRWTRSPSARITMAMLLRRRKRGRSREPKRLSAWRCSPCSMECSLSSPSVALGSTLHSIQSPSVLSLFHTHSHALDISSRKNSFQASFSRDRSRN